MKAITRRLRQAAAIQSGVNRITLEGLADAIDLHLRRMTEAPRPDLALVALDELRDTLARAETDHMRITNRRLVVRK